MGGYQRVSQSKRKKPLPLNTVVNLDSASDKESNTDDDALQAFESEDGEDSESQNSFSKKAETDIQQLLKATNKLKMKKKMQQQENLLNLKRKNQDDDWETNSSASKLSAQRAMFSQIWSKIQEQEKLLSQPID